MTTTIEIERTEAEELAAENAALAQHQAAIDTIQARRAERQRAFDIQTLEQVRNELSERTVFFQQNHPAFLQQSLDFENGRSHILAARDAIAESKRRAPVVVELLPEDAEVKRWRKAHDQVETRLAEAQAAFDSLPNPEHLRAQLATAQQAIQSLTHSANNLTRKLSGETGTAFDGGVTNVDGSPLTSAKSWVR